MAEEESNPGTLMVVTQAFYCETLWWKSAAASHSCLEGVKVILIAGMIVFLLLLWAAIGHKITARYCCKMNILEAHPAM